MFKVNSKKQNDVTDVVLLFLLLSLNRFHTFFSIFIADFEQVNVCRESIQRHILQNWPTILEIIVKTFPLTLLLLLLL